METIGTVTCPTCRRPWPAGADVRFCRACGTALRASGSPGHGEPAGARRASAPPADRSGARPAGPPVVGRQQAPSDPVGPPFDGGPNVLVIVLAVAGTLLVLGLGAMALLGSMGGRERANDRAAQSDLRSALVASQTLFSDAMAYPALAELQQAEPMLRFVEGAAREGEISVASGPDAIYLARKSTTGTCFYIVSEREYGTGYAKSDGSTCHARNRPKDLRRNGW